MATTPLKVAVGGKEATPANKVVKVKNLTNNSICTSAGTIAAGGTGNATFNDVCNSQGKLVMVS